MRIALFVTCLADTLFPDAGRATVRLLERLGPVVRVVASDSRSQARNRELAVERLRSRLAAALRVDPTRRPTRPTLASKARRVETKRRAGALKRERQASRQVEDSS